MANNDLSLQFDETSEQAHEVIQPKYRSGAPTRFNKEKKLEYLEKLAQIGVKRKAAWAVDVSPGTVAQHRKRYPIFEAQEIEAIEEFKESLEQEVYHRAVVGWQEPVFYEGEVVGYKLKKSDRMLENLLRKNIEAYRVALSSGTNINANTNTQINQVQLEAGDALAKLPKEARDKIRDLIQMVKTTEVVEPVAEALPVLDSDV